MDKITDLSGNPLEEGTASNTANPDSSGTPANTKGQEIPTTPATPSNSNEGQPPANTEPVPSTTDTSAFEGVNTFLGSIGIKDGVIVFNDNEKGKFEDLTPELQHNVLDSVVRKMASEMQAGNDLTDEEYQIINAARESNMTPKQYMDNLVNTRVESISVVNQANSEDFDSMDDKAIYIKSLKDSNPDITDEAIEEELSRVSEATNFSSVTELIRNNYKDKQNAARKEAEDALRAERDSANESFKGEIANAAVDLDNVAGFTVTDDEREHILSQVIDQVEDGDSVFVDRILSDPNQLVKAAYWDTYGENMVNSVHEYYKGELAKANQEIQRLSDMSQSGQAPVVKPKFRQPMEQEHQEGASSQGSFDLPEFTYD